MAENWFSQGRRQGLRQGLTRGLELGRTEALRDMVTALLAKRFKKVPAERDVSTLSGKTMARLLGSTKRHEPQREDPYGIQALADEWRSKGRRHGRRQGLTQGLEQGRAEALREVVSALLSMRFKKEPAKLKGKLAAADGKTLHRWFDAAYDASSIEAVFKA